MSKAPMAFFCKAYSKHICVCRYTVIFLSVTTSPGPSSPSSRGEAKSCRRRFARPQRYLHWHNNTSSRWGRYGMRRYPRFGRSHSRGAAFCPWGRAGHIQGGGQTARCRYSLPGPHRRFQAGFLLRTHRYQGPPAAQWRKPDASRAFSSCDVFCSPKGAILRAVFR